MRVISVVGHKKTGKTTLVTKLVAALSKKGSVGSVKSMVHQRFNPQDTDTGKHFDAGADVVVGVTKDELITIERKPELDKALNILADKGMDFAVVEGEKSSSLPKIVLGELEGEASNVVLKLPEHPEVNIDELVDLALSQPEWVTLDLLINRIKKSPEIRRSGSIGTFTGIVREHTSGTQTTYLDFEKYEKLADEKIDQICNDLKNKEGILDVLIHHKTGRIDPGEDIVYIVIASAHRKELFPALSEAIERVKSEVPIWKKEFTIDGDFWVHDHA